MKQVILSIFLVCLIGGVLSANIPEYIAKPNIQSSLVKIASLTILQGFKARIEADVQNQRSEIKTPIIGLLPDPVIIDDFDFSLSPDSEFGEIIHGNLSVWDASITGLASIKDDFVLNLIAIPAVASYTLDSETVSLHGSHDISVNVSADSYSLVGESGFELKLVGFMVDLEVKILVNLITNKVTVTGFYLDIGFEDFLLTLGETLISDEPIEWDIINKNVNCIIQVYRPFLRDYFNPLIKEALADLLKDCKLTDLINGDLTCINFGGIESEINSEVQAAFPELAGCKLHELARGDWRCMNPEKINSALELFFESLLSSEILDFECPNRDTPIPPTTDSSEPSETSTTTDASEPSETPTTTEASEPSETPTTTDASEPSETPTTTEASEPSETPTTPGTSATSENTDPTENSSTSENPGSNASAISEMVPIVLLAMSFVLFVAQV